MPNLNWRGLFLGGLAASILVGLVEFVQGIIWGGDWLDAMKRLGVSTDISTAQNVPMIAWVFVIGFSIVWLAAAIEPLFAKARSAALCAGSFVWMLAYLVSMVPPLALNMLPLRLGAIWIAIGLIETVAAALAGSLVYHQTKATWTPHFHLRHPKPVH